MKTKLQKDFLRMFSALFIVLITVWLLFYFLAMQLLVSLNEQLILRTSNELLEDLSSNIELMEQINYSVSQKNELREFLSQNDLASRHSIAGKIDKILTNELLPMDNRFSIVIFDENGWFYRFAGSITVTECERLSVLTDNKEARSHFTATLDGNNHIGYSSVIFDEFGHSLGTLFVLESEDNFLEYYYNSTDDYVISAAILSGDEVISSNAPYMGEDSQLFTKRQVGITPFQVATWLSPDYDNTLNRYFLVGGILSCSVMIVSLLLFVKKQQQVFFEPLVYVMSETDKMGDDTSARLKTVDNVDFDNLINKINDLISRINKQNEVVKNSLLEAEHSKTETQHAINILLKKQINAHFIVNTLSSIQVLQKQGHTQKSEYALAALSDMVRYAFDEKDDISVWDELSHLQKYVDIMNVRYGDKIIFELEADDNLMDFTMPRMIIQPIIENSIIHGFAHKEENCLLTLTATQCENGAEFCITDNGCGMSEETITKMNMHFDFSQDNKGTEGLDKMAVYNVKRRLYNDCALSRFYVSKRLGGGSTTTMTIIRGDVCDE